MKIDANSIRVGNVLEYHGKLWVVLKTMHTQPGKGGAYMQVEMKEMQAGTKTNVRFRSSETVEKAYLDTNDLQYLYTEGNKVALMDMQTYEQVEVDLELIGDLAPFLKEGMNLVVQLYESKPVSVFLPEKVEGIIAECEPVIKGQTATSSYKPAVLENGVRIMVPPFINQGDKILVSTVTLEYLERA
ncbi:MAG: elongation factor P [Candidatus Midichloria sp.]